MRTKIKIKPAQNRETKNYLLPRVRLDSRFMGFGSDRRSVRLLVARTKSESEISQCRQNIKFEFRSEWNVGNETENTVDELEGCFVSGIG